MTEREHMLPANIDAERDVLGSILRNRDALTAVVSWLQPGMFYLEKHRWVYEAVLTCFSRHEPPDIRMVSEELRRRDQLELVGGIAYLSSIDDALLSSYHIEYYARIVERLAGSRDLIAAGGRIAALGYDEQDELEVARAHAQTILTQATQGGRSEDLVHVRDVAMREWDAMNSAHVAGIKTGFRDLDEMTGGLQHGDLLILAARPSVGKTSMALSLAYGLGKQQHPVLLFSLEMTKEQLIHRLVSIHSGITSTAIRDRLVAEGEPMARLADAFGVVSELPIILCDNAGMTIAGVRARVMRHLQHYPDSVIIVDYLQLMIGGKSENRVQEVSHISRGLKQIARDANVPLIALSQLSRAVETRTSHVPMLSDLRESGSIEQDSDIVIFIYREELYDKETDKRGIAELHIAKHRNGECGVIPLRFDAATTRFSDLSFRHADGY
jgi:replicative DNA helicase